MQPFQAVHKDQEIHVLFLRTHCENVCMCKVDLYPRTENIFIPGHIVNLGFPCCFTVEVHFPIVLLDECFSAHNKPLQWWFV